jgi:hypothetical protein
LARRLHESVGRYVRQVSNERANRSWFVRVMNAPRGFTFESFSSLLQGNQRAQYWDQRAIVSKLRRAAARLLPQKAA